MADPADPALTDRPGHLTPAALRWIRRVLAPLVRVLHRPTLTGLEHLPTDGPFMLVANHSAGLGLSEIGCLLALYAEAFGDSRPLAGFAHPLGMRIFPASVLMRHVGAVPSTYAAAEATLAAGVPLLVFPGGDHETMRPLWQAGRVDFGGRRGFLRIARKMGVPVVPLGIRGSHLTAPILWRSRHILPWLLVLPRLVGLKRWALTLLGVAVAAAVLVLAPWDPLWRVLAAWAVLTSPLIFLPYMPTTITLRIGPPLAPEALFDAADPDLSAALARVEAAVQSLVA